jgi:lysine biosynthesis protein LysW
MVQCACPTCQATVKFIGMPVVGERITCGRCGDLFKVVTISPIKLEWAFEDLLEDPEYSVRSYPYTWNKFQPY